MSIDNAGNTPTRDMLTDLHETMIDLVSAVNLFQRDATRTSRAGTLLDRALFPLLVIVKRRGPIGIVQIAGRVGRDYTTVSRQIGKLEDLGLVRRQGNAADRRVREAVITAKGRRIAARFDAARERMGYAIFETWSQQDCQNLVRLMRRFADAMKEGPAGGSR
jgi:DNA-binding MarR family transcriptional regulator